MDQKKTDYQEIKSQVERRGIHSLIHFTPTLNLMGIIEHGAIYSRAKLEQLDIEQYDLLDYVQFTDQVRYDDKNFINLSITLPNKFLFKRFQERTADDPTINWCILKLDVEPVYLKETLFSVTNAASTFAKCYGIKGDVNAFENLFLEELNLKLKLTRPKSKPSNHTTDLQAEVLVKDQIPVSFIQEVCFPNDLALASAKSALRCLNYDFSNFRVDKGLFH